MRRDLTQVTCHVAQAELVCVDPQGFAPAFSISLIEIPCFPAPEISYQPLFLARTFESVSSVRSHQNPSLLHAGMSRSVTLFALHKTNPASKLTGNALKLTNFAPPQVNAWLKAVKSPPKA